MATSPYRPSHGGERCKGLIYGQNGHNYWKKKNPPASYTPRAPSKASRATRFQRKHGIYDNVISECDAPVPRTKSPLEKAESTNELSSESRFAGKCPSKGKKKQDRTWRKCIWYKQNSLKIERLVKFYMKC